MKRVILLLALCLLASLSPASGTVTGAAARQDGDKLVYADFETAKDNVPVSSRGGVVQLNSYQERSTVAARFKGLQGSNPPAPEFVRLKKDDPNRAIAFEYELTSPNQYAGVGVEVNGHPYSGQKPVPDDVSKYKYLTLQMYVTGVTSMRIEFISRGQGFMLSSGWPQLIFKVSPGFNTYKIPLKSLSQPSWVDQRVDPKDVLKKLTSINLIAFCEKCVPVSGTIVVDNLVFQN